MIPPRDIKSSGESDVKTIQIRHKLFRKCKDGMVNRQGGSIMPIDRRPIRFDERSKTDSARLRLDAAAGRGYARAMGTAGRPEIEWLRPRTEPERGVG